MRRYGGARAQPASRALRAVIGTVLAAALLSACSSKTKTLGGGGGSAASGGASGAGAGGSSGAAGAAGSSSDAGGGDSGKTLAELCDECVMTNCAPQANACTAQCASRRNCILAECAFETDVTTCAGNACSASAGAQTEYAALESCVCNSPCKQPCDAHMNSLVGFIVCAP